MQHQVKMVLYAVPLFDHALFKKQMKLMMSKDENEN